MNPRAKTLSALALSILVVCLATPAAVSAAEPSASPVHVDLEIDPIAYAFGGYSLHVGIGWESFRLDLGAFAMDFPEFFHGNEGFDASFGGFGMKLQYFLFAEQSGGFVGVSGGMSRALVQRRGTEFASATDEFSAGVNLGWRFDLPAGFYATPWIGVDYAFGERNVEVGGEAYQQSQWTIFPTVHLGYQFH